MRHYSDRRSSRCLDNCLPRKCGLSPARARSLVLMARRPAELPETRAAFVHCELCEGPGRRRVPPRLCRRRRRGDRAGPGGHGRPTTERLTWRLSADSPADEGAIVEGALVAAHDELFRAGGHDKAPRPVPTHVDWADALIAMADRSGGAAGRPHQVRNLALLRRHRLHRKHRRAPAPRPWAERRPTSLRRLRCVRRHTLSLVAAVPTLGEDNGIADGWANPELDDHPLHSDA